MLRGPDSTAHYHVVQSFSTDNFGYPWVTWLRWWYSGSDAYLEFSKWNGSNWQEPVRVPDTIHPDGDYSDQVFDQDNKLFLIYFTQTFYNYCDIYSTRYDPSSQTWELPKQVNSPDTSHLDDFYPRISIGGGEIWATWFNEIGSNVTCDIKTSHWNNQLQLWEPEMTVNPDSGGINRMDWSPDIAVDTDGIPHVVWIQATPTSSRIRYSKYVNNQWTQPIFLTNPDSVIPTGPYGGVRPKLVIDNQNILHCVFPGYKPDTIKIKVYYTKNNGSGWSSPIAFDTFSGSSDDAVWESDIAASSPNNIWVV
jgi:hypothetical protein